MAPPDEAPGLQAGGISYLRIPAWIFGKKGDDPPAGLVRDIDPDADTSFGNRMKDEIKNAPEFDESRYRESDYRNEVGTYYGPGGAGYRETP